MNRGVTQALADVDVVVFVVEAKAFSAQDRAVIRLLPEGKPVILAVNKTDMLKEKNSLLPLLAGFSKEYPFAAIVPVCATRGINSRTCLQRCVNTCHTMNCFLRKTTSRTKANAFSPRNISARKSSA